MANRRKAVQLSEAFGLEVAQSKYSDWGNFYGLIKSYPCALWDNSGYVIFSGESDLQIPGISIGKKINIPKGISSLERYRQVIHDTWLPEELPDDEEYQEGTAQKITVNRYERDTKARAACLSHYGYSCQICNVTLSDIYGVIAEKLIHVHHIKPISEIGESYVVDPINDLIPVCPNCHAVLHLQNPPFPPREISALLNN